MSMQPADDADTQETPLTVDEDDALVELDEAEVQEIRDAETTGTMLVCRECARSVYVIAGSPPPSVEDLVTSSLFWEPKGADGKSERCTVSGEPEAPVWWFCAEEGWLVVRGVFRAKIERL
jgi:hypothetical protein